MHGAARVLALAGLLATVLMVGTSAGTASATPAGSVDGARQGTRFLDPVFAVRTTEDLVYGRVRHADGTVEELRLDLFRPAGDDRHRRPVVVFIHGGDSAVDKSAPRNRAVAKGFARRGFVSASIAYRDGTSGISQESQHDTRAAVRWFRARAGAYRVDRGAISVMGSSSGAVNALQVAFEPEDAGSSGHPGRSSRVAAAIGVSGLDYEVLQIGTDEVPVALVHALDDTTIPYAASVVTCEQTRALGNVCELFGYQEGGHPPQFLTENRRGITEQASRFLCDHVLVRSACGRAAGQPGR